MGGLAENEQYQALRGVPEMVVVQHGSVDTPGRNQRLRTVPLPRRVDLCPVE